MKFYLKMKKIISLGHGCWQKILIRELDKKDEQESDVFDWMKSFNFTKLIEALESNLDIFNEEDIEVFEIYNSFYNFKYDLYLPHDEEYFTDKKRLIEKYQRRLKRLSEYESPIVIREINYSDTYSVKDTKIADFKNNSLIEDYNNKNYDRIMKFLPKDATIILFSQRKIDDEIKEKISSKFYLIDDCYDFQESLRFKPSQLHQYRKFFRGISKKPTKIDNFESLIKRQCQ
jgi:hypothetical protein